MPLCQHLGQYQSLMKSYRAVFPEPGRCEIEPFDLPELSPDQVLVQIEASLISPGTETTIFTGKHSNLRQPNASWPRFPFHPGYSAAGKVLAVGAEVKGVKTGDRIFAAAQHATHAVVPAGNVAPIPEGLSIEHATFAEIGAIALNGVRMAGIGLNDSVIVAGLGLVGLLTVRLLKLSGAMPLLATDLSAARRELGIDSGADKVMDPLCENVLDVVRAATGGRLADVVIDATGVPRVVAECFGWARRQGRVVLLGSPHGGVKVNFYPDIHGRNLHVIGAHLGGSMHPSIDNAPWSKDRNWEVFLQRAQRGDIQTERLITRRITPCELEAAYRSFADPVAKPLGVVVDWTGTGGQAT